MNELKSNTKITHTQTRVHTRQPTQPPTHKPRKRSTPALSSSPCITNVITDTINIRCFGTTFHDKTRVATARFEPRYISSRAEPRKWSQATNWKVKWHRNQKWNTRKYTSDIRNETLENASHRTMSLLQVIPQYTVTHIERPSWWAPVKSAAQWLASGHVACSEGNVIGFCEGLNLERERSIRRGSVDL